MKTNKYIIRTTLALSLSAALAACGGGGGGGGSSAPAASGSTGTPSGSTPAGGTTAQTATSANVSPAQYTSDGVQAALFSQINTYRSQCGLNEFIENTTLDQSTANHATYMADNSVVSDSETSGLAGYTGNTYIARAASLGYPSSVAGSGESTGIYTSSTGTNSQYGQTIALKWLSGVYHGLVAVDTAQEIGVGVATGTYASFPALFADIFTANPQASITNGPVTFPCQGVTGVAYGSLGDEVPAPPGTSGAFGAPVQIADNPGTTLVLSSATMTDPNSNVITLNLLDSANDTNGILLSNQAVAYPTSSLKANTAYAVSITGTDNGVAFSRNFTFTTGNTEG